MMKHPNLIAFLPVGYFQWWLVLAYVVLLAVFIYGILRPRIRTEWKSASVAQAWVIALYAEMYGVPLTAYFLMGALGKTQADAEDHFNGHLWPILFGVPDQFLIQAQFICTVVGQSLILVGAVLAVVGWRQLYRAVKRGEMADSGLYRYIRHPQYTGFYLFLFGSVINWPTLLTVVTLPVLCVVYFRLSLSEEQRALAEFGDQYQLYMQKTGRFLPRPSWA